MAKELAPNVLVDHRCGKISVACLELMPVWSENLIPKCKVLWTWQSDQPLGVNLEAFCCRSIFCFMVRKDPRQGCYPRFMVKAASSLSEKWQPMAKELAPNFLVDHRCGKISVACLELMPVWSENLIPKCKVLWTWQSDQPPGVNLEAFCFMVCKVPRQGNRSLALGIASVSQQPKSFDHAEAWKQAELWTMTSGHLPGPTLWGSTTWRRCNAQQAPNCGSVCTVGFELRTQHLLALRAKHPAMRTRQLVKRLCASRQ